jgi:transposase
VTTVILGLDPHPHSHTIVALEAPSARLIDTIRVENTEEGLEELRAFAGRFSQRRWAIEGATNPFIAPWAGVLVGEGEDIFSISPALTSQYRKRRGAKKNDETDAMNAARALLANPQLPAHLPDPHQRRLQEITRNRRRVAADLKANRMALGALASSGGAAQERKILEDIVAFCTQQLGRLDALIGSLLKQSMPELLAVRGVGEVFGAVIVAEVGDVTRFGDENGFASYCGAAPVSRGSGKKDSRVGVNAGGNRRMNHVLHVMALVRLRSDGGRSRELVERKRREGKTMREALRVLKTYIARELYRTLKAIQRSRQMATLTA